jgi:hypothetical protein
MGDLSMKSRIAVLAIVGVLTFSFTSRAAINSVSWWDDGDYAIICQTTNWNTGTGVLSMSGDQYWGPGHMVGTIDTSTAEDPTLTLASAVNNDTSFAWTAYDVNVYMSTTFTLTNVTVSSPLLDWTVVSYDATPTFTGSNYVAHIVLDTGTPVAIGDELDFTYQIKFASSTHYAFTQEMIPVPEPGTFALAGSGLILLVLFARHRRGASRG